MRTSVIIPVYNREAHVGAAIRSLLRQCDEAELDIIVVDDGSIDGTADAVQAARAGSPCVRLIQQANQGVSAARNTGLDNLANDAELVTFLDSDDLSVEGRFAAEVPLFCADAELALTYSLMTLTNEIDDVELVPAINADTCTVRGVSSTTAIFRRSAIESLEGFNGELEQAEDWDLLVRFFERRLKYRMLDHVSVIYRRHEGNATNDREQGMRHFLRALLLSKRRRRADPAIGEIPKFFDVSALFNPENAMLR